MTTKKITFDPESGVAYSCDLVMNVGADFNAKFNIVDTANTGFNFSTTNSVGVNTSVLPSLLSIEIIWPFSFKLSNPGNGTNIGSDPWFSLIA